MLVKSGLEFVKSYRIVFAGTPDFAAKALAGLLDSRHKVIAVYTQPDRPAGRGQKLLESPVKLLALEKGIAVEQPLNFKDPASIATLASYEADIMVVAAYGIILPKAVLDTPSITCLNIHASLLPRWRGAAPIQRAILANDQETGISIMKMAEGLDTGDVLLTRTLPIASTDTGSSLHDKLAILGQSALLETLEHLEILLSQRCPQNHEKASYAHKLSKSEARIDWSKSAREIENQVRAFNSWPVAFTIIEEKNIRIWQALAVSEKHSFPTGKICAHDWLGLPCLKVACGDGFVAIEQLQLPGKKAMSAAEILNSRQALFSIGKYFE